MRKNKGASLISLTIIVFSIIIISFFIYQFYFAKIEQVKAPASLPIEKP